MAYKPFDLTGKVALVTGGNGGIGLGMAEAMAQAGADIVIWGTNDKKNAAAEAKLKEVGVNVLALNVNVADEAAVVAAMAESVAKMGRVDNVVANAGIGGGAPSFSQMTTETWRRVM
ncbi:MAG TPA: SDR family NAD(P)-dependent oxidoreductase, partial [Phenylobacterium sp.]|nr:SDR family NAD(P)-dependent oxidoreductase [Phenylobacterium sp.]